MRAKEDNTSNMLGAFSYKKLTNIMDPQINEAKDFVWQSHKRTNEQ